MTPARNQRGSDERDYGTEAEKMVDQKNDRTIAALVRGIQDVDRARDFYHAICADGDRPQRLEYMAKRRLQHLADVDAADTEVTEA